MPVVGLSLAEPSHVVEQVFLHEFSHVSLHEEEQSLAQLLQVGLVAPPLHDDEQSEHGELVELPRQLPVQKVEQLPRHPPSQLSIHAAEHSLHVHDVNVVREMAGPNTTVPKIGKVFVVNLLKNSRLV